MFPPATRKQMQDMGWDRLDVILVTGDAYVDVPHMGAAVIANVLMDAGFRTGVITQPDMEDGADIARLGEPELFWGVTGGCMDSMVANYTASGKKRKSDDLTAGGQNTRRPDRAVIAYTNLIRRHFKNTRPIVLGGMEASLRRISHYDFKTNKVRRSILFDAKADVLIYGMGEKTVLELARRFQNRQDFTDLRGICYAAAQKPEKFLELPSHGRAAADKDAFTEMFAGFYKNTDPVKARGLCQLQDTRYLVCNPPQLPLSQQEIDRIHELGYRRRAHPVHADQGNVRALDTIAFSIISHRGCYGECHFCAITALQGKTVISRSRPSILREAESLARHPDFKGVISDVGGPTANMYGIECRKKATHGACIRKRCLGGRVCPELTVDHGPQVRLLKDLRKIAGIKHVFIGSGIRHDLILADSKNGQAYLEQIISHHISGQLKIAPEHSENHLLDLMGKPNIDVTRQFIRRFRKTARRLDKKYYLTGYFLAAYPGCTKKDMEAVKDFCSREMGFAPEQVQIFTPVPATVATLMYWTKKTWPGKNPLFVETDPRRKQVQKQILTPAARAAKPKKPQ
ncbi:MAG: YgiQ family radical SAM protein [Desulfobacterales bacterium]|nr:YgiQ family radical SAM protein [Desulfobacterales bacterium]